MAQPRNLRIWALALWCICLLGPTVLHAPGNDPEVGNGAHSVSADVASTDPGAAVLRSRVRSDVRAAVHVAPLLVLILAVLPTLVRACCLLARTVRAAVRAHQPLRARRHAIALRAPPLRPA